MPVLWLVSMVLPQAARACGLPKGTFYAKARKLEEEGTP